MVSVENRIEVVGIKLEERRAVVGRAERAFLLCVPGRVVVDADVAVERVVGGVHRHRNVDWSVRRHDGGPRAAGAAAVTVTGFELYVGRRGQLRPVADGAAVGQAQVDVGGVGVHVVSVLR